MALFEGKTPAERNKTIAAIALGAISLFFLVRLLFFGSASKPATPPRNTSSGVRGTTGTQSATSSTNGNSSPENKFDPSLIPPQPVEINWSPPDVPVAGRNIFAYYVPPSPQERNPLAGGVNSGMPTPPPTPTPPPPPPLTLASLSPVNVYARTGDFTLQVSGDKFTPAAHIFIDNQDLPTRFISPQQLSATVPAALVAAPGARQVVVRTPDNQLYSNTATLNVTPPPTPTVTFVGFISRKPSNKETAVLKNQSGELVNVQRGDIVGQRFRVTNISERAIEFTDTQLNIKHTLPYIEGRSSGGNPAQPFVPPPQRSDDDDEP